MEITIDTTKSMDEIIKQVEEAKAKEPKRWRAEIRGSYFYVDCYNYVGNMSEGGIFHNDLHYKIGNYLKTEEEAEQEARLRDFEQRVAARIRELNGDKVYKLKVCEKNWSVWISLHQNRIIIDCKYKCFSGQRGWWSDKKSIIEQVIEEFGPENFINWAKGEL